MYVLKTPAIFNKLNCEPIEQLRMRRRLALQTKIIRRSDNPPPKMLLPKSIHNHSRRQRMIWTR